ncbi:hypothetical protein CPC08DRAFT_707617 [Agrocybe pediades]|nr:hypothetical protein CPC08DRAFT_707617 [Agrocybe pediades]
MSTGNKRRRVSPSPNSQTTTRSNVDGDPLSRLTDLTTQVIETAKLVKATPDKGAAVHKVRELADLLLLKVLPYDLIAYDVHKSWFQHHVDAFLNYCDQINVEGYEMDHMLREITRKIIKWLPKLWLCMVEEDADLGIIAKCFALCSKSLERLSGWISLDETVYHSITIVDLEGNTVYSDNKDIDQTLDWMWKELIVIACSRNVSIKSFLDYAGRFISMKHVCQLIRQPGHSKCQRWRFLG